MRSGPLRIAMVLASPFPANHGTPAAIAETAVALTKLGHQVRIVTYSFGQGDPPAELAVSRIPDLRFGKRMVVGPTWQKPLLDLLMVFSLVRVVYRERIDVLHAHNYEGALIGFVARLVTGRPLVYNAVNTMSDELPSYGFIRPEFLARWLARILDYWVPRTADRIIAISEELVGFLQERGVDPRRIEMIPLGVDLVPFDSPPDPGFRARKAIQGTKTVIYTGVLDRFQRIDYLLRAMQIVAGSVADVRLLLVVNIATEDDVEECAQLIRELELEDRVRFFLDTPFDEVPHFLREADVAVAPRPNCPGFPLKLLNYMAARKAIVVFEGSAKGLKHGSEAIVVKDDDWQAMGAGIATLLEDRSLAERMGEAARSRVEEEFSWSAIADRIVGVYRHVLETR